MNSVYVGYLCNDLRPTGTGATLIWASVRILMAIFCRKHVATVRLRGPLPNSLECMSIIRPFIRPPLTYLSSSFFSAGEASSVLEMREHCIVRCLEQNLFRRKIKFMFNVPHFCDFYR